MRRNLLLREMTTGGCGAVTEVEAAAAAGDAESAVCFAPVCQ